MLSVRGVENECLRPKFQMVSPQRVEWRESGDEGGIQVTDNPEGTMSELDALAEPIRAFLLRWARPEELKIPLDEEEKS